MGSARPPSQLRNLVVSAVLLLVSCAYAIAASLSKDERGDYPYKTAMVPLLAEICKALISAVLLARELRGVETPRERRDRVPLTPRMLAKAAVPGVAYQVCGGVRVWGGGVGFGARRAARAQHAHVCSPATCARAQVLNNLNFVTLHYVDMTTFQIMSNLKIVATGVASYCLLGRRLNRGQWLALVLLTLGAATTQLGRAWGVSHAPAAAVADGAEPANAGDSAAELALLGCLSALTCALLSAVVGVYTEKFMKGTSHASIHWQNLQLYVLGVGANVAAVVLQAGARGRDEPTAVDPEQAGGWSELVSPLRGFNAGAIACVFALAFAGLSVSFLLRFADSIAKTYATALAAPFTAIVSRFVLSTSVGYEHAIGMAVMLISFAFYYAGEDLFRPLEEPAATASGAASAGRASLLCSISNTR